MSYNDEPAEEAVPDPWSRARYMEDLGNSTDGWGAFSIGQTSRLLRDMADTAEWHRIKAKELEQLEFSLRTELSKSANYGLPVEATDMRDRPAYDAEDVQRRRS